MHAKSKYVILLLIPAIAFMACNGCKQKPGTTTTVKQDTTHAATQPVTLPSFNADSAYSFIKTQVSFGPRIPGTKAHEECLQYFLKELGRDSLKVTVQRGTARTYDGKVFQFQNIIASVRPDDPARIVLFGHWDTRPWADLDTVNPTKPFDGADDGGSSAAMLLELARHLHDHPPAIGVDLVFLDLEDYGEEDGGNANEWCLGSQYWAKNLPPNYAPRFGILLDMVGGKNAVFPMEGTSMKYAPDVVNKIWNIAAQLGYSNIFTRDVTVQTTDDHLFINQLAGIPTIDIVDYRIKQTSDGSQDGDYPYFHHKHSDNMSVIDTNTLNIVGHVLLTVIYSEKAGNQPTP